MHPGFIPSFLIWSWSSLLDGSKSHAKLKIKVEIRNHVIGNRIKSNRKSNHIAPFLFGIVVLYTSCILSSVHQTFLIQLLLLIKKRHDLIHDLAQSNIGIEILILRDDVNDISKRVHHVSLFGPLSLTMKALKAKSIRTFLVRSYHDSEDGLIVNIILSNCKFLHVLRLDRMKIEKVWKSLGKLSHLRYLDLSHGIFKVLPNTIARLKNLQTHKIFGCSNLEEFRKDIRELINLRHLKNDKCGNLTLMPCGIESWLHFKAY